jgi:hypothetical protein
MYMCVCMYVCIAAWKCQRSDSFKTFECAYIHACIHIYLHTCRQIYILTYKYAYIHTYIHAHTWRSPLISGRRSSHARRSIHDTYIHTYIHTVGTVPSALAGGVLMLEKTFVSPPPPKRAYTDIRTGHI